MSQRLRSELIPLCRGPFCGAHPRRDDRPSTCMRRGDWYFLVDINAFDLKARFLIVLYRQSGIDVGVMEHDEY
jgi:hypothetical protein